MTFKELTFIDLFACLKGMSNYKKQPRLRFRLTPQLTVDFFYFPDDDAISIYQQRMHIGFINYHGELLTDVYPRVYNDSTKVLLLDLQTDFLPTLYDHGKTTGYCPLCGNALVDPSALSRGLHTNCLRYIEHTDEPSADLGDIP